MNQFTIAYLIAAAVFVVAIWLLLYVDVVGPGLGRLVARIVGRTRDRKVRRAWWKWRRVTRIRMDNTAAKYTPREPITPLYTDPRTEHHT